MIKRFLFPQYMLAVFLLTFSTAGMTAEKTSWADLSPKLELPGIRLAAMISGASLQHRRDLFYLRNLVRQRGAGQGSEEMSHREMQAMASLKAGGFDAEGIVREMKEMELQVTCYQSSTPATRSSSSCWWLKTVPVCIPRYPL
jgi:hypothetical protein